MKPQLASAFSRSAFASAVAFISGAALAYEILLMRLFSIIQWHHFAYLVISLALLGYGVSGVVLALARDYLLRRFASMFPAAALLFGITAPACFWLAQWLPFNPAEIFWTPQQWLYLFTLYILLAIPFFFAASAVGLALYRFREYSAGIYAADLLGAGVGSILIIGLLLAMPPARVLVVIAMLGIAAVIPVALDRDRMLPCLGGGLAAVALLWLAPPEWQRLHISTYKELPQLLRIPGTRIIDRFSGPIGDIDVVESPATPLRYAPGLSLNAETEPPQQYAVFTDAGNMTALTRYDGNPQSIAYVDQNTAALAFHLRKPKQSLILGAGTGADLLQARFFGVEKADAVELNGQLLERLRERYDAFSGGLFKSDTIRFHVDEARGFVMGSKQRYDLIQIALLDAFSASSAGLYALSESYLYTVEALREYIQHLQPQGYLAITRWVKMPPRDALKLFATAVDALQSAGSEHPGKQLLLIRSWQTSTMIVKNGEITAEEIAALQKFCADRSFDIDYYPGITEAETNRFNILPESYYYQGAWALLGPKRAAYSDRYKFDIRPATDDRPYFFQFFKWTTLPEIVSLYGRGGISLLESGYVVLVLGLLQAFAATALCIGLPLWLSKDRFGLGAATRQSWRILGFFGCLGLGFLFIEMAFIQKFILFLHHPVYSVTVVLATFLLAAGMGSFTAPAFSQLRDGQYYPVIAIVLLAYLYVTFLPDIYAVLGDQKILVKITVSVLLITPLGYFMGILFPLGLQRANALNPAMIPWAWAVNGFASVISAILATLIAIHAGFNVLILTAGVLYILAAVCLPESEPAQAH